MQRVKWKPEDYVEGDDHRRLLRTVTGRRFFPSSCSLPLPKVKQPLVLEPAALPCSSDFPPVAVPPAAVKSNATGGNCCCCCGC
jgi:hypothetical protein